MTAVCTLDRQAYFNDRLFLSVGFEILREAPAGCCRGFPGGSMGSGHWEAGNGHHHIA